MHTYLTNDLLGGGGVGWVGLRRLIKKKASQLLYIIVLRFFWKNVNSCAITSLSCHLRFEGHPWLARFARPAGPALSQQAEEVCKHLLLTWQAALTSGPHCSEIALHGSLTLILFCPPWQITHVMYLTICARHACMPFILIYIYIIYVVCQGCPARSGRSVCRTRC